MCAAENGDDKIEQLLIDHGAEINAVSHGPEGTSLMLATVNRHVIDSGANVSAKSEEKWTALM